MSTLEQLKQYREQQLPCCELCVHWFLGCLNGRKKWKDKAITPNQRYEGERMLCDAFEWDSNSERLGRAVYQESKKHIEPTQ